MFPSICIIDASRSECAGNGRQYFSVRCQENELGYVIQSAFRLVVGPKTTFWNIKCVFVLE